MKFFGRFDGSALRTLDFFFWFVLCYALYSTDATNDAAPYLYLTQRDRCANSCVYAAF